MRILRQFDSHLGQHRERTRSNHVTTGLVPRKIRAVDKEDLMSTTGEQNCSERSPRAGSSDKNPHEKLI
jgi:hypothetical protein